MPLHLFLLPGAVALIIWLVFPGTSHQHHPSQRNNIMQSASSNPHGTRRPTQPDAELPPAEQVPGPVALAAPAAILASARRLKSRIAAAGPGAPSH
jgi:hypothetical protein